MKPVDSKTHLHIEMLESGLERLHAKLPQTPVSGILLSRLLIYLGRDMVAMLDHYIRPVGLAEAEFRVLMMLFVQQDGVAHPSDLCARAAQSPANMSRICDELVRRDLITRVPSDQDRRRMVLRITTAGEALVRGLLPKLFGPLAELFGEFSDEEQRHLIDQLKRLAVKLVGELRHDMQEHAL